MKQPTIQPQPEDTRTPYERFEDLAKQVFSVSKEELDKRLAKYEREKQKKKRKKPAKK
jgi:hypothetical protein